ncbi:DMT family transporter [Alkaliphilus peptidifermentans]|uniref:Transporter family-2 protein n=1 Tax=Alkaliphilus peptidifermentans DSM 18978 TaxID=1120976 RepID=A0A1G5FLM7_9FIRM|nr:DMT family transporter [Alkaliphilus peptidifermentans]SCY40185.1 transporter family-2 protein [Alkaliphilus peptidifermentans DSM 18978]
MNYLMALLIGILLALFIHLNGLLSIYTDVYSSSLIVHFIGMLGAISIVKLKGEKSKKQAVYPFYFYSGGVLGALIVVVNNISFQWLGVSVTVAFILLGQIAASLVVDNFGLLGMKKIPQKMEQVPGFLLIILGVIIMMIG